MEEDVERVAACELLWRVEEGSTKIRGKIVTPDMVSVAHNSCSKPQGSWEMFEAVHFVYA